MNEEDDNPEAENESTIVIGKKAFVLGSVLIGCLLVGAGVTIGLLLQRDSTPSPTSLASSQGNASTIVSFSPSLFKSLSPTLVPSSSPSQTPTTQPTLRAVPSSAPSLRLSSSPSIRLSVMPSHPTTAPSSIAGGAPTTKPSEQPRDVPTTEPFQSTTLPTVSRQDDLPTRLPTPFQNATAPDIEDPFNGARPEMIWPNDGNGLRLTVLNALNDTWQDLFNLVVEEWENGTPDALQLNVVRVEEDPSCRAVVNVIKACNGNYGETRWRGITKTLLSGGNEIYSATVQLNEFYLGQGNENQRRYTLCHELGHALSLGHTDEDFFNPDSGNCLDYTNNPENNQSPGTINFEQLALLYGTVPNDGLRV